jgi:hypothetical protein
LLIYSPERLNACNKVPRAKLAKYTELHNKTAECNGSP